MEGKQKTPNLRTAMPLTAELVDRQRAAYGAGHVNACIKAAMDGVPGRFYAMEAGHVLGAPFVHGTIPPDVAAMMVNFGCAFVCIWAAPGVATDQGGAA